MRTANRGARGSKAIQRACPKAVRCATETVPIIGEEVDFYFLITAREMEFFVSQDWEVPDTMPAHVDVLGEW
ncbi:MAG: hypothetical protein KGM18_00835 [Sphingomonadales bacterium]|nr:hypothetical protein [Sphingomonadales bacterium]